MKIRFFVFAIITIADNPCQLKNINLHILHKKKKGKVKFAF